MHAIFGHAVSNTATLHVSLNCSIWLSHLCIHDGMIAGWCPCVGVVLGVLTAGPRSCFGMGTMVHEKSDLQPQGAIPGHIETLNYVLVCLCFENMLCTSSLAMLFRIQQPCMYV